MGAVPAWLQARRGSHIVITTIMFNFIAAALMVYLLVNVLIAPGSMAPQTRTFAPRPASSLGRAMARVHARSTSPSCWRCLLASRSGC